MNSDMLTTIDIDHLRTEALDLYDRCLAEGNPNYVMRFVERQLSYSPPRLSVVRGIADDLQQQLMTLRENLFNVRAKVVHTFKEIYQIDVTPLMPPDQLDLYHAVKPDMVVNYLGQQGMSLSQEEKAILKEMIQTSRKMASELQTDILLTTNIQNMISDWVAALSAKSAHMEWFWKISEMVEEPIH